MEEDLEFLIYQRICKGCPNERMCHEECEQCEKYYEMLEEAEK